MDALTSTAEKLPDAVAVMDPSTSSAWPAKRSTGAAAESSRTPSGHPGRNGAPSTTHGGPCIPELTCAPTSRNM